MEVARINVKKYNLSENLSQDRSKRRNEIHVVNPTPNLFINICGLGLGLSLGYLKLTCTLFIYKYMYIV